MNDDSYRPSYDALNRPTGPKPRRSIRDSNDPESPSLRTMSHKKKSNSTSLNSSFRNTSRNSSTFSSPGSPRNDQQVRRRSQLYPDLRDMSNDKDELNESTPVSADRDSSNSSGIDYSLECDESPDKLGRVRESEPRNLSPTGLADEPKPREASPRRSASESEPRNRSWRRLATKLEPRDVTPRCVTNKFEARDVPPRRMASDKNQSWYFGLAIIVCCLAIAGVILTYIYLTTKSSAEISKKTELAESEAVVNLLRSRLTDLQRLFPSQDRGIWGEIASGISDVKMKRHSPAIFLLLAIHNETTNCLAKKVAEVAKDALKGTGEVVLKPNMLENNISRVFEVMEERIQRSKAVVVLDFLSLKAEAIKAFHVICDQYDSLVKEAVYLYVMRSGLKEKSTNLVAVAEKELRNSFSQVIKEDTLQALITRLTNGAVFAITAEKSVPCAE